MSKYERIFHPKFLIEIHTLFWCIEFKSTPLENLLKRTSESNLHSSKCLILNSWGPLLWKLDIVGSNPNLLREAHVDLKIEIPVEYGSMCVCVCVCD